MTTTVSVKKLLTLVLSQRVVWHTERAGGLKIYLMHPDQVEAIFRTDCHDSELYGKLLSPVFVVKAFRLINA